MPRCAVCQNTSGSLSLRLKSPSTKHLFTHSKGGMAPPSWAYPRSHGLSLLLTSMRARLFTPTSDLAAGPATAPDPACCPHGLPGARQRASERLGSGRVIKKADLQRLEASSHRRDGSGLAERRDDQTTSTAQKSAGMFRARESPPRTPL